MLDDQSYFREIDKSDAVGIALQEPNQLLHHFGVNFEQSEIKNIVYAGMGGSALAATLSLSWPRFKDPFEIVRGYNLPPYVNEHTLCIVSSYSGNTEETLSALNEAESKAAKIIIIAGGGKLEEIANEKKYPLLLLPSAKQPRYGVFYNYRALIEIALFYGVALDGDISKLEGTAAFLNEIVKQWHQQIPVQENLAKQIALDCLGKSVVVYGGPLMAPAAYKWKIDFNENAKQVAWNGTYSEFNHNEFIGWSKQPTEKPYAVVDLRSSFENPMIMKRFFLSERLLSGLRPAPIVVNAVGVDVLSQLLYCVLLGDFVSLYCAIAAGTNPEPVELVEKFKQMLRDQ